MGFIMACFAKKRRKNEELLKGANYRHCEDREKGRSFTICIINILAELVGFEATLTPNHPTPSNISPTFY
jgi:hypothetical protein